MRKNFLKKAGLLSFCAALIMNVGTTFAAPTDVAVVQKALEEEKAAAFPVGGYNARNVDHFTGDSYVAPLSSIGPMAAAVTFYDGARTHWHVHHGSCQILLGTAGEGYYQIWGEKPQKLLPGKSVTIPEGVKHWHGAAPHHTFQHVAVMERKEGVSTEWFEAVVHPDIE